MNLTDIMLFGEAVIGGNSGGGTSGGWVYYDYTKTDFELVDGGAGVKLTDQYFTVDELDGGVYCFCNHTNGLGFIVPLMSGASLNEVDGMTTISYRGGEVIAFSIPNELEATTGMPCGTYAYLVNIGNGEKMVDSCLLAWK